MGLRFLKILLFFYFINLPSLWAQQVYWKTSPNPLAKDQDSLLELVFEDCQPEEDPQLPNVEGLAFGTPSTSSEYAMENFQITQRAVLSYPIQPLRQGTLIIPAFQVETTAGPFMVPALTLQVGAGNLSQGKTFLNDIVLSQIRPVKKTVWLGEIFNLDYILLVSPRYHAELAGPVQWTPEGLVLEDWGQPTQVRAQVGGESRQGVQYMTRACALKSGLLNPTPAQQKLNLQTGTQRFGFFSRPKLEQFLVESEPFTLEVKSLPPSPNDFLNAVGKFEITSRIVPQKVTVGEPITWTLQLSGTGNWPAGLNLPQREVANDFRAIEPKSKLEKPEGKPFEGILTEDVILIPTKPGRYTLGPLNYSYFDPELGNYVTLTTEPVIVEVNPSAANPLALAPPSQPIEVAPPESSSSSFSKEDNLLPQEPIAKNSFALSPKSSNFFLYSISPLFIFFALWIGLAFRRSHTTDPRANQKAAKTKLLHLLKEFNLQPPENPAPLLIDWQRYAAQCLNLSIATPHAQEIEIQATALSEPQTGKLWQKLWLESEHVLFSSQAHLPPQWLSQAQEAIQAIRLPRQSFWKAFLPRNFFPLILFFASSLASLAQSDLPEIQAYQSGNFVEAEERVRKKIQNYPQDWAARNNLGLALAQQQRWPEATAHWIAGRLLNSRNSTLQWNSVLGMKQSGFTTETLLPLTWVPAPIYFLASPAEWQWLFFLSLTVLTLGFSIMIWNRYHEKKSKINKLSYSLIFLAFTLALFSSYAWRRYQTLAHPSAGLVWKSTQLRTIPTDAETQASRELGAGSIGTINKTFLGWLKITLPNQETGWIRKETFVYFYRAN